MKATVPYFKAVAIDYDGTLTEEGPPDDDVLGALGEVRAVGVRIALVTGRVISDLLRAFPEADQHFDVIVAENGAVVRRDGISRALTAPVPLELDAPLVAQGVHFQRGQVLLACAAADEIIVLRELRRLEVDCQLVRNRQAVMVLPAAVSKGSGLLEALQGLGISYHSVIGIGDAENDLALLRQCELGVAVGNAVESLKRVADIVLCAPSGQAVAEFLRNQLLGEEPLPLSRRWQVALGRSKGGDAINLPASRVNLLIVGGSGVGKSYAAGLLAERLIERDYSVCVVDPEGDHAPLGRLPNVLTVGGRGQLPAAEDAPPLMANTTGSLVVDLSLTAESRQESYVTDLLLALDRERSRSGLPHWILVDEAQGPFRDHGPACQAFQDQKGLCLVTYDAASLCRSIAVSFDFLIAVAGDTGLDSTLAQSVRGLVEIDAADGLPGLSQGDALLVPIGDPKRPELVTLGRRFIRHVRHWHKYASAELSPDSVFVFRTWRGPTGAAAHNLSSFRHEILVCDPEVLHHHAPHHDFSLWLERVIRDPKLAVIVQELEARATQSASFEDFRRGVAQAIEDRYLG